MTGWDGRGLPPVAAERMERFARTGLRTSLLTVPGALGIQSAGFEPVGEVMGCIVEHIGWSGFGGCGYFGGFGGMGGLGGLGGFGGMGGGTVRPSGSASFVGFGPYVDALYRGYDTALERMTAEAAAMDADGVVGVRLPVSHLGADNREFFALGTAVRARSRSRNWPRRVFTTDLAGQDVAKLVLAGWVPSALVYGISVLVRHDDWQTQRQSSWAAGNTEVSGYTELVTHVRADARHRFDQQARSAGAEGAIVSSISLTIGQIEPSENHRDHVAESTVFGTALVNFHRDSRAPTRSLTILPLR
jgi:uncharacterized protein YbjQ (UPF0145 family)